MENKLQYASAARCFEEALPLGNGSLGAMVYGGCQKDKISLNHDTLWSGNPRRYTRPKAFEAYQRAQQLVLDGKIQEATTLLRQDFSGSFGQSYLPLGNLYIERVHASAPTAYRRELNLETGMATVAYTEDGTHFTREYFVSHPDNALVIHLSSDKPCDYIFSMDSQLPYSVRAAGKGLRLTGECPSYASPEYAQELGPMVYDGTGIRFAAMATAESDGTARCEGAALHVKGATEITFILCVKTSFISFDTLPEGEYCAPCEREPTAVSQKAYRDLRSAHTADVSSYYNRVRLDLGFPASEKMTDERLLAPDKAADLGLIELLFNFGRYLTIASSRAGSQATNLQGIWNEHLYAPWSSNYTVNINTQMNYWPTLMCHLPEMYEPLVDLIQKISVTGRDVARDFYHAEGFCAHHNIDLWGIASPVGNQSEYCVLYGFWNVSAGWLCRHLWEYYEYTLDKEFLQNTAYPLMKGAAEFFLSMLIEDNGKYIMCPSTSPENFYVYRGESAQLARFTTMSQAIVADLFTCISHAADVLAREDACIAEVREKLPRLNTFAVGAEGQLLEFDDDYPEVDCQHRHTSHLYALYPGEAITAETTPELAEACRRSLLRRGDFSTGWSMVWRAALWAKLKDGDHALSILENLLTCVEPTTGIQFSGGGSYANLLDAQPPFQIDGNFGTVAAIALLFLQCEDGKIRILPALPKAFKTGSVSGLMAKGNITVDIAWEIGRLVSYALQSPIGQTVTVATPKGEEQYVLTPNERIFIEMRE